MPATSLLQYETRKKRAAFFHHISVKTSQQSLNIIHEYLATVKYNHYKNVKSTTACFAFVSSSGGIQHLI